VTTAREAILAAVRSATAGARASDPVHRGYRRAGERTPRDRIDLLSERLVDYRATVRRVPAFELPAAVAALASGRIGVPPGLPDAWRPVGAVEDHGLAPHELDALDSVLTGCTLAIAETGTLVLAGGPTEGRRALTLVPDLHVCVVGSEQVVETVPEAFEALRGVATRPLTLVSGPSATSDIELKRVEGVHGPRRLVVVIVEQAGTLL
jgi:L-lactate dehydrogenase complex protein LldG